MAKSYPSLSPSVQLGKENTRNPYSFGEDPSLLDGVLTDGGVQHQEHLDGVRLAGGAPPHGGPCATPP